VLTKYGMTLPVADAGCGDFDVFEEKMDTPFF
jgi:hypothetical protein